jgi:hypothetical protein
MNYFSKLFTQDLLYLFPIFFVIEQHFGNFCDDGDLDFIVFNLLNDGLIF